MDTTETIIKVVRNSVVLYRKPIAEMLFVVYNTIWRIMKKYYSLHNTRR